MSTVTIGGKPYEVYGTLTAAKDYLAVSLGDEATAWNALLTDDAKGKTLIVATRFFDRLLWAGTPVGVPEIDVVLQWPRTGVTDRDGNAVDDATVPKNIEVATYELASMIAADPSVARAANTGSNIASLTAGPAGITYFRPTDGTRMASVLLDLVSQYLASGGESTATGGVAYGTCAESQFDTADIYRQTR